MGEETWRKLKDIDVSRKVWIGGLPNGLTWKELEKHFHENIGTKPSISEILPKGQGVCAFKTEEEATAAIAAMNGTELKGKTIEVDVWTQKEGGGGGDSAGKWALVEKIKEMQRSDADIKAK